MPKGLVFLFIVTLLRHVLGIIKAYAHVAKLKHTPFYKPIYSIFVIFSLRPSTSFAPSIPINPSPSTSPIG